MKTYMLIPSLVSKAKLLVERHQTVIDNEYQIMTSASDFVRKHNEIDTDIKIEKERSKKVDRKFFILDICVAVILTCIFLFLSIMELLSVDMVMYNWYETASELI